MNNTVTEVRIKLDWLVWPICFEVNKSSQSLENTLLMVKSRYGGEKVVWTRVYYADGSFEVIY